MNIISAVTRFCAISTKEEQATEHTIRQLAPDDIISQLPDDILISILSFMVTKDATRTSILSNRWRNLYKSVPSIGFQCDHFFGLHAPHDSNIIINTVDRHLSLCSGHEIKFFYFSCCLSKSDTDQFEKCICCLGMSGVEELFLKFSCYRRSVDDCDVSFSFHLLSKMPSLKFFTLMYCSLNPNLKTQCKFLQSLSLSFVKLPPAGGLECILSNCPSLESLVMSFVKFQYPCRKLCFRGPNLRLKTLTMEFCQYFDEIEFYASNLIVFELLGPSLDKLIFDHAPQMESVRLSFLNSNIMSYVFEKLAMDLPHLKSLTFANNGEFYELSSRLVGIETFGNLRRLGLTLKETPINLLSLIPVLHGCPLLEEFNLATQFDDQYDGPELEYKTLLPSELKMVEISGFRGTENEIEFALYIMRNAIGLEQMHIVRHVKFYTGFGSWIERRDQTQWDEETRKLIEEQLKGQCVNKTARLTIEHLPPLDDVMERWRS